MPKKKLEKTESEIYTVESFVHSEAWPVLKRKLLDRIFDLQNPLQIDDEKEPAQVVIELRAHKLASSLLLDWLREIEGAPEQAKLN